MSKDLVWIETESGPVPVVDGKKLASTKSLEKEAITWVSRLSLVRTKVVVLGLGAGKHVELLKQEYPNHDICVYEPVSGISEKINIGIAVMHDLDTLREFVYTNWGANFQVLIHPASGQIHAKDFARVTQELTGRSCESLKEIFSLQKREIVWREEEFPNLVVDRQLYSKIAIETKNKDRDFYYKSRLIAEILR